MTELNPNHPVTQAAHDHWHKIVALLLWKYRGSELPTRPMFSLADVETIGKLNLAVVLEDKDGFLSLRLLPMAEAERLAREEGGLPL